MPNPAHAGTAGSHRTPLVHPAVFFFSAREGSASWSGGARFGSGDRVRRGSPRTRRGSGRACGVSRRVARRPPRDHPVQTVGAGPPRSPRGKAGMGFALKYQHPRSIGGRGARVGCRTDLFFDAAAGHVAAGDPHGGLRRATSQVQERGACGHRALARCAMARGNQAVGYRYRIRRQITTQDLREDWRVVSFTFRRKPRFLVARASPARRSFHVCDAPPHRPRPPCPLRPSSSRTRSRRPW